MAGVPGGHRLWRGRGGGLLFRHRALAWFSRIFSFSGRAPVTVFLICGHFPHRARGGIYYTGYHFFMRDNAMALTKGLETIKIAIAIALGIGIVLSLPQFFFTLRRKAQGGKGAPHA